MELQRALLRQQVPLLRPPNHPATVPSLGPVYAPTIPSRVAMHGIASTDYHSRLAVISKEILSSIPSRATPPATTANSIAARSGLPRSPDPARSPFHVAGIRQARRLTSSFRGAAIVRWCSTYPSRVRTTPSSIRRRAWSRVRGRPIPSIYISTRPVPIPSQRAAVTSKIISRWRPSGTARRKRAPMASGQIQVLPARSHQTRLGYRPSRIFLSARPPRSR